MIYIYIYIYPFPPRKAKQRLAAYDAILTKLKTKGLDVDLQILDNEASKKYKTIMTNI